MRSRVCLQMTEANHAHCYAQNCFVREGGAFVAQTQPAKAFEPSEGAFDCPAVRAQAAAVFFAGFGQLRIRFYVGPMTVRLQMRNPGVRRKDGFVESCGSQSVRRR